MGFYDEIAKGLKWEITSDTNFYLKVVNDTLLLPNPKWLQYHLRFLDNVIEAINAFRQGELVGLKYDISKIKKTIIEEPKAGITCLQELSKNYKTFAIDIESQNLSTDKMQNSILCIGIAYKDDEGVSFLKECFLDEEFVRKFNEFTSNKDLTFILHNGLFDRSRTKIIADLDLKIDEDTLLKHYCGINEHKGTHGLKDLAQLYLGFPDWEKPLDDWRRSFCRSNKIKLSDFQYSSFPQRLLAEYNIIDCCATFQLNKKFDVLMRENSKAIYRKLIEASKYYADMISRGMQLDIQYMKQLEEKLNKERDEALAEFEKSMPGVSVTSPIQLKKWLERTFPGEYIESTDAKTISSLADKYPDNSTLKQILAFRKNAKYLRTYVVGLQKRKDYQNIIHCEFKLHGTETGRLSSSNPNMQNIPRNALIKNLFRAREGYKLLQLDYSQSELRVLAYVSQDEKLTQCYVDGRDLHGEMQKQIFKEEYDPHDKDQRMAAKIVNFGIPYGRTPGGVAKQLNISIQKAKQYLADWFAGAPKVKDYISKCHKMATADPQDIYYTVFGRARHYFVTSDNIHHVENQAVNFPISSTANDLTIHALVEIGNWLEQEHLDAYLVNTVHDSIILEVREKDAARIAEKCQYFMSEIPKRYLPNVSLPFKADAEVGDIWGELTEPDWGGDEEEEEEE